MVRIFPKKRKRLEHDKTELQKKKNDSFPSNTTQQTRKESFDNVQFDSYLNDRSECNEAFSSNTFNSKETTDHHHSGIQDHIRELEDLKTSDPSFYKFLSENDQELLNFGKDELASLNENDEESNIKDQSLDRDDIDKIDSTKQELTSQQFFNFFNPLIQNTSECSSRNLFMLLQYYRSAIRSIVLVNHHSTSINSRANIEGNLKKPKFKDVGRDPSKKIQKTNEGLTKERQNFKANALLKNVMFYINADSEEGTNLFKDIVLSTLKHISNFFEIVLEKKKNFVEHMNDDTTSQSVSLPNKEYLNPRVNSLLNSFWLDTILLLEFLYGKFNQISAFEEEVLKSISNPWLLRWMIVTPSKLHMGFQKALIQLWLEARRLPKSKLDTSLFSFVVIRNWASFLGRSEFHYYKKEEKNTVNLKDLAQEAQQNLISNCYKGFITLVSKVGFSWRLAQGYHIISNCLLHLFNELHPRVAYRVCFLAIRQLALIVRNATRARSQGFSKTKGMSEATCAKLKAKKIETTSKELYSWAFIMACQLLTQITGTLHPDELRPLGFPLSTILTAAIKSDVNSVTYAPWTLRCLQLQCDLMSLLSAFIPMGSHLLSIGLTLLDHQNRLETSKKPVGKQNSHQAKKKLVLRNLTHVKNPNVPNATTMQNTLNRKVTIKPMDIDIVIRLPDSQLELPIVASALAKRWTEILVDHIGLLSRHPSFPEAITPLTFNLKTLSKCKNDESRKQLKHILTLIETSMTEVRTKRLYLNPLKPEDTNQGRLLIFEKTSTSLSKYRETVLKQRNEFIQVKIDAEQFQLKENDDSYENKIEDNNNGDDEQMSNISTTDEENIDSNCKNTHQQKDTMAVKKDQKTLGESLLDDVTTDVFEEFSLDSENEE